jgi:hypothetical protein
MDPLSDVMSLLKRRGYKCGGLDVGGDLSVKFPEYEGIRCYAMVSGECWLSVEGVSDAVHWRPLTASCCRVDGLSASPLIWPWKQSMRRRFLRTGGMAA